MYLEVTLRGDLISYLFLASYTYLDTLIASSFLLLLFTSFLKLCRFVAVEVELHILMKKIMKHLSQDCLSITEGLWPIFGRSSRCPRGADSLPLLRTTTPVQQLMSLSGLLQTKPPDISFPTQNTCRIFRSALLSSSFWSLCFLFEWYVYDILHCQYTGVCGCLSA